MTQLLWYLLGSARWFVAGFITGGIWVLVVTYHGQWVGILFP